MNYSDNKKVVGAKTIGEQKIALPTDPVLKSRLMAYHGVTNDYDLKLALYRDMLKKQRNARASNSITGA